MKIAIIGANGYGGIELIRLLQSHPNVSIEKIVSHSTSGLNIVELYPHLRNIFERTLEKMDVDEIASSVDLVFFATPSGVSKELIPSFIERGLTVIDLSGDFRLKDSEHYKTWYKKEPAESSYLEQAVYGLSEIYRGQIKEAKLIANPGCFPTAVLLGLAPALKEGIIKPDAITIDAKTGVSGAGRNGTIQNLFTELTENIKAYKVGQHQHIPEIEQTMVDLSQSPANISFITHLVPMSRGILSTMYCDLTKSITTEEVHAIYKAMYQNDAFIRIRPIGQFPATKEVTGSNYCDIGLLVDERTNKLIVVSAIDNLVKGAAGQAIQNMNIINGWQENTGLQNLPLYP